MHNMHTFSVYNSNFNIMELFDKMKKGFLLIAVCFICIGQIVAQNVAKIGSTEYATLQEAVDAAYEMTGDVTIELLKDISGYSIVHQKAGLNVTIEGDGHTCAGQIIIDGDGRASGTETLTIQNINFQDDGSNFCSGLDGFIMIPSTKTAGTPYYTSKYNYAHNVTIDNCVFTSTSASLDVVGIKATSGATWYNATISNCTGENLHSLGQLTATEGATIDHCSATNTGSFVNVAGGTRTMTISNCTFTGVDPSDGYAVRENSNSTTEIVLSNNTFEAFHVLQLGKGSSSQAKGHINVESGTYKGVLYHDSYSVSTSSFVLTGGTYNQDAGVIEEYCPYGYEAVASDPEPGYCTVRKLEVAQIGTTTYPSLQAALDAAHEMTGDVTIELLKNTSGYSIVHQKAGLNITIEGNDHTVAGQIIVDGDGRDSGTETLTVQNIAFNDDGSHFYTGTDAFVLVPSTKESGKPWYTNKYNYAHNITVSDCDFISTSSSLDVVGFKATSGAGNYNTVITGVTGDNLHSLAQFTGTTGATITNDTITNSESFVNVNGGGGTFNVNNCKFTTSVTTGYAIRENGSSTAVINLENNEFLKEGDGLVIGKGTSVTAGTINVTSGFYEGNISKTDAATGSFVFTGGTFTEDVNEYCATGYAAFDDHNDAPHTWTVYPMAIVHFDANGGEGTMADTIGKKGEPFVIPECKFTPVSPYNFAGWKDVLDNSYNVGSTITLTQDTTLIAQWSLAKTITYHSNFGTDVTLIQSKLDGETVTLYDATAFEWVGHNLVGWNTQADGNGSPYALGADYSTDENLILYAVWELKPCPNSNTVTDADGNTYETVRVGSQYRCWMNSNLKSVHYSDGTREIQNVMSYPTNTRATVNGNLYDWYAVMDTNTNSIADIEAAYTANTSLQGICPTGYHIPTQAEVMELMSSYDPKDLMSQGNWIPDNGTNASGFNMLPSGSYNSELNRYERMYVSAYFWIFTPPTYVYHACEFGAACSSMELIPGSLNAGYSVRCVIDE